MIEVQELSKRWGDTVALDRVSLSVPAGRIHGLIGADGAGKSTLFDILVTLTVADSGRATVGSHDVRRQWRQVRRTVGYMPAQFSLYGDLSVRENLVFFANIYRQPLSNVEAVGEIWEQIEPFSRRPAAQLSGGMKQKLALCCAMIHNPDILMLDEPTTGVDPISRREFWEALRRLADGQGKTILVSTSYMDEAARCDRMSLIHQGKVLDELTPNQVGEHYRGTLYEIETPRQQESSRVVEQLRLWSLGATCYTFGDRVHLNMVGAGMRPEIVTGYLRGQGITEVSVRTVPPVIEDLFIQRSSTPSSYGA